MNIQQDLQEIIWEYAVFIVTIFSQAKPRFSWFSNTIHRGVLAAD
ncbi:hypothetical protein [Vibrio tritonius]|nr:hypothetical protein [Vibrio tritonius]